LEYHYSSRHPIWGVEDLKYGWFQATLWFMAVVPLPGCYASVLRFFKQRGSFANYSGRTGPQGS
jgi:hypothetical protein